MQNNFAKIKKTISIFTILMMISTYFIPAGVYAVNEVNQNANTKEENVKFNAMINGVYDAKLIIGSEANLQISASVQNAGYLKDAKVMIEGNNYSLQSIKDENVKTIKGNEISLNEIDEDQSINVNVPIRFNMGEMQTESDFNKESKVKLEATYVNGEGKENKIEKVLAEKVNWDVEAIEEINQKMIRYIKYEDKTLITFEVSEGIKDNAIPVKNKQISIIAPKIDGQNPVKTIASGNEISYQSEDGITKIQKTMPKTEDGKYNWNSQDKYLITYIYNSQTNLDKITTTATATAIALNNKEIQGNSQINEYETTEQLGSLVEVVADTTKEINKGYMYTNTKKLDNYLETQYTTNYRINIGLAEVIDGINAYESDIYFTDSNGEIVKDAVSNVKVSKVKVSGSQVADVLGNDGIVTIKDENGKIVAQLNSNEVEKEIEAKRVTIETTKPVKEGTVEVALLKSVITNNENSKEEVARFNQLTTTLKNEGYNEGTLVSNAQTSSTVKLTEPTSKASIDMNTNRLSTVVENKNVSFNIVLNKNDINDALYTNPTIKIRFPEEITKLAVKSARVLYEDEIKAGNIEVNEREISLKLQGEQTTYNKSTTTKGTLIKIEADIGLNMLAPSNKKNIEMIYTNDFTGETKTINKEIEIIAPSGFVTTNTIKIDEQSATALENDAELIKVRAGQNSKTMEVSANIVNNLETSANGLTILGRIPAEGNKTIGGADLGSTITTTLSSAVETTGLDDAVVYYSDNIDETVDGNGWTNQPTTNTKSFKIVKQTPLADKTGATFKYTVSIPENLDYEKQVKENFGIIYNNDSEQGVSTNLIEAKTAGIMTGVAPAIKTEISAIDTNQGYAIDNNGTVTEGEYITYRVKVSNTGSYDAHNVNIKAQLPDSLAIVDHAIGTATGDKRGYFVNNETKSVEQTLETLAGGQSQVIELNTQVTQVFQDATEETKKIIVGTTTNADILEEAVQTKHTAINSEGTLNVKLSSYQEAFKFIEPNTDVTYEIKVTNPNITPKENAVVKLNLPSGIVFDSILSEKECNYDEASNVVNINLGTIAPVETVLINVKAHNNSSEQMVLKTNATVIANGMAEEAISNTIELRNEVANQSIKATQTSNITNNINDTDELHFYIDIENNSNLEKIVEFVDEIGSELRVVNYLITIDGQTIAQGEANYINEKITIPGNKSAKVTIITDPYTQPQGNNLNIENKPIITSENGINVDVNSLSVDISGTEKTDYEIVEKGDTEKSVPQEEEQKFKITGEAWLDENKDGRKQNEEPKFAGIRLQLFNTNTNKVVTDENGNEIVSTSNNEGLYEFTNIPKGEYVVIAYYDENEYELTSYRADNLSDSENSDFVTTNYNEEIVGVTDVQKLNENSQYNVDLGIVKKSKFDLGIVKSISKVTVSNSEEGTKQYDVNNNKMRIELSSKALENSTILVEYNIQVTNNGDVAGYAKSIVDYLPKGMTFSSELNKDWYLAKDGNLYTVSLANKKLNPGESENIKLVLTKKITNGNIGIVRGKSAISTTYNELGLQDISAQAGTYANTDGNMSSADIIIAKNSQGKVIFAIGISLGIIAIIGFAIYELKKHLDKKYYIDSDI